MGQNDRGTINVIQYNENGVALLFDGYGVQIAAGLEHSIAKNLIVGATNGQVLGYVATAATTLAAIRGTAYTERTTAGQLEVVSSSASDASAGTGSRTVRITYFDNTMAGPFTEDKTLNGTSAVATVATNMRFVEKIESLTVGSNGTNVGTITLRAVSAGATVGTIAIGDGVSQWAHHYVATGKTCFIKRVIVGVTGNSGNTFLKTLDATNSVSFEKQITPVLRAITAQPSQIFDMEHYIVVGPARITLYTKPDSNTAATFHGGFSYYEM